MKKNRHIPKSVIACAADYGYNDVEYIATDKRGRIYSAGYVVDGDPAPTGLPAFVVEKDGECRLVDGLDGMELHSSLF